MSASHLPITALYVTCVSMQLHLSIGNIIQCYAISFKAVPSQPNGVRVMDIKKDHIDLAWRSPNTDGGSPLTGYIVEYRESSPSSPWSRANQSSIRDTNYRIEGLKEGKYYDIRVSAQNAVGIGNPTEVKGQAGSRATPGLFHDIN